MSKKKQYRIYKNPMVINEHLCYILHTKKIKRVDTYLKLIDIGDYEALINSHAVLNKFNLIFMLLGKETSPHYGEVREFLYLGHVYNLKKVFLNNYTSFNKYLKNFIFKYKPTIIDSALLFPNTKIKNVDLKTIKKYKSSYPNGISLNLVLIKTETDTVLTLIQYSPSVYNRWREILLFQ